MLRFSDEVHRPSEWLRRLEEDPSLYERLLSEAGGVAPAAYRLARARCQAQAISCNVPTLREVKAAALAIVRHCGSSVRLPVPSVLLLDCEQAGLPVIAPLPAEHSAV
jgi:hypothetical protein